jgi:hypothetical protein
VIFRALQGHWKFSRVLEGSSDLELGNNEPCSLLSSTVSN